MSSENNTTSSPLCQSSNNQCQTDASSRVCVTLLRKDWWALTNMTSDLLSCKFIRDGSSGQVDVQPTKKQNTSFVGGKLDPASVRCFEKTNEEIVYTQNDRCLHCPSLNNEVPVTIVNPRTGWWLFTNPTQSRVKCRFARNGDSVDDVFIQPKGEAGIGANSVSCMGCWKVE